MTERPTITVISEPKTPHEKRMAAIQAERREASVLLPEQVAQAEADETAAREQAAAGEARWRRMTIAPSSVEEAETILAECGAETVLAVWGDMVFQMFNECLGEPYYRGRVRRPAFDLVATLIRTSAKVRAAQDEQGDLAAWFELIAGRDDFYRRAQILKNDAAAERLTDEDEANSVATIAALWGMNLPSNRRLDGRFFTKDGDHAKPLAPAAAEAVSTLAKTVEGAPIIAGVAGFNSKAPPMPTGASPRAALVGEAKEPDPARRPTARKIFGTAVAEHGGIVVNRGGLS